MGLDAVVYKNRKSLPFDPKEAGAVLDGRTGEFYFQDEAAERRFKGKSVVAASRHLGNVRAVELLSEAVERCLGQRESVLLNKVLYSATHAGDVVEPLDFQQLRSEIEAVRKSRVFDQVPALAEFLRSMEDLLNAAMEEGNPIVFT